MSTSRVYASNIFCLKSRSNLLSTHTNKNIHKHITDFVFLCVLCSNKTEYYIELFIWYKEENKIRNLLTFHHFISILFPLFIVDLWLYRMFGIFGFQQPKFEHNRAGCHHIRRTRFIRWQRQHNKPHLYDTFRTGTARYILVSWKPGKQLLSIIFFP